MTREQLIKQLRKWAKANGTAFAVDVKGGKGGHCKVTLGGRGTIVQSGPLRPHYIDTILRQLGIPKGDIRR